MKRIIGILGYGLVLCLLLAAAVGILQAAGARPVDLLAQIARAIVGF